MTKRRKSSKREEETKVLISSNDEKLDLLKEKICKEQSEALIYCSWLKTDTNLRTLMGIYLYIQLHELLISLQSPMLCLNVVGVPSKE